MYKEALPVHYDYDKAKAIIREALNDQDELGGPMQRIYPRAVIESLADGIAGRIQELCLTGENPTN